MKPQRSAKLLAACYPADDWHQGTPRPESGSVRVPQHLRRGGSLEMIFFVKRNVPKLNLTKWLANAWWCLEFGHWKGDLESTWPRIRYNKGFALMFVHVITHVVTIMVEGASRTAIFGQWTYELFRLRISRNEAFPEAPMRTCHWGSPAETFFENLHWYGMFLFSCCVFFFFH